MKKFLIFFLFVAFAWVPGLRAETSGVDAVTEVVDLYSTPEINYQETSKKLQKIEDLLKSGQVPIQKMSDEVRFLEDTRGRLMSARKSIDQELKFVQKRIDALGEAPEDGSQELAIIAQKREEFSKEDAYQKGKLAEADILLTKIDELNALILDIRNRELLGSLITKQSPLYYPHILFGASRQFVEFVFDIIKSPVQWYGELNDEQKDFVKSNIIPVGFTVLFSLWLGIWLRLFIMRRFGYKKGNRTSALRNEGVCCGFRCRCLWRNSVFDYYRFSDLDGQHQSNDRRFFGLVLGSLLYYSLYVIMAMAFSRVTLRLITKSGAW